MPATQQVLEKPEEDFNRPSFRIDQPDDFGRWVEQVGGDPQHTVAVGPRGAAFVFAPAGMWRTLHAHQPNLVIRTRVGFAMLADEDDLIAENTSRSIRNDLDVRAYLDDVLRRVLAGETDWSVLTPHVWKREHPASIREYRQDERRQAADRKRTRRARRRLLNKSTRHH